MCVCVCVYGPTLFIQIALEAIEAQSGAGKL